MLKKKHEAMNSIGQSCNEVKHQYDDCFKHWFTDRFLKGERNLEACDKLFKQYQQCVKKTMKEHHIELKEVDADYLGTEKEYKVPPNKE